MITYEEKSTLEKFKSEWRNFKKKREKKKFDNFTEDGWIPMLQREDMLDFFIGLTDKVDFDQFCF